VAALEKKEEAKPAPVKPNIIAPVLSKKQRKQLIVQQ
jgi:hypothetical protein